MNPTQPPAKGAQTGAQKRGRPHIDQQARTRDNRRRVLEQGMLAGYELLDGIRNELAEINEADRRAAITKTGSAT